MIVSGVSFPSNCRHGQISQRMANKRRIHSAIAIELFFEGKNHQRLVDILAEQFHTSLAPSPELRADVVDHRNTAFAHLPRYPPVECRRVDDDCQGGTLLICRANQFPIEAENLWQMAHNLSDADDGEIFGVDDDVAPRGAHALPTCTEELERWILPPKRFNQLRAVHFAGGFTGRDQNLHGDHCRGSRSSSRKAKMFLPLSETYVD